jgi:DNA repair protein RadA/Sms
MALPRYVCTACGDMRVNFKGRCPSCGSPSTLVPIASARTRGIALPIGLGGKGKVPGKPPMRTGIVGLDEMASTRGGLVHGKCYMLVAAPGSGKSTMCLQVCAFVAGQGHRVIDVYIEEGEDTAEGLMERLGLPPGSILGVEVETLEQLFERTAGADLVVLDSLQGLRNRCGKPEEEIADEIGKHCHETGKTFILISHVNKEGEAHGAMETQHWVDAVLELSGKKGDALRLLASSKNRLGPTDRVRFLRMTGRGLVDMPDASSFLLTDRTPGEVGSAVAAVLIQRGEGSAAVLVEVQAMLTEVEAKMDGSPARAGRLVCASVDGARMRVIMNILEKIGISTRGFDVTVNVCGDIEISDRGLDLPVALAVASAKRDTPLPEVCAWGELDLVGHIRGVTAAEQRAEEAKRAKFKLVEGKKLREVIDTLLIEPSSAGSLPRHARAAAPDAGQPDARRGRTVRVPAAARRVRAQGAGGRVRVPDPAGRKADPARARRRK